jgi:hypothetical protein
MHADDQERRFERRSASADAAALRLSERESAGDEEPAAPEPEEPEREGQGGRRRARRLPRCAGAKSTQTTEPPRARLAPLESVHPPRYLHEHMFAPPS